MLVSERNKRLFHILGIQALYIKFTQKYKVSWRKKKNHSPVRNVLSSPAKSPAHNTNSQEPAAFNYSHLADTFIQNTFPIPPRWGFFFSFSFFLLLVAPVGMKTFAAIHSVKCQSEWRCWNHMVPLRFVTHTDTFFSLYFPRSYTWEGAFWGALFKLHSSFLCLFSVNFICRLWRLTFKESSSSIRKKLNTSTF